MSQTEAALHGPEGLQLLALPWPLHVPPRTGRWARPPPAAPAAASPLQGATVVAVTTGEVNRTYTCGNLGEFFSATDLFDQDQAESPLPIGEAAPAPGGLHACGTPPAAAPACHLLPRHAAGCGQL